MISIFIKRFLLIFLVFTIFISLGSALLERTVNLDKQNPINAVQERLWLKYPPIKVESFLGFDKADLILETHTDTCLSNCKSEFNIHIYSDSALVDAINFYDLEDNNKLVNLNYDLEYISSYEYKNVDYKVCSVIGVQLNGSNIESCSIQQEERALPIWSKYNLGQIMPIGDYTLRLKGSLGKYKNIDWKIITQEKEIDEWAIWANPAIILEKHNLGQFNLKSLAITAERGILIRALSNISNFNFKVNRTTASTTTNLTIYSNGKVLTRGNPLATSIVGTNNQWSITGFNFTEGYYYWLVASNGTSHYCNNTGLVDIIAGTYVNWSGGIDGTSLTTPDNVCNIKSLEINSGNYIYQNIPLDNDRKIPANISFSCNISSPIDTTLHNASIWSNITGGWDIIGSQQLNGTTNISNIGLAFSNIGTYIWACSACDNIGNCGFSSNRTLFISPYQINSVNYFNQTSEGNNITFSIQLTMAPSYSVTSSYLMYNTTAYVSNVNSIGNNVLISNDNFVIPLVNADTNIPFYWIINLSDGSQVNTSVYNIFITNTGLDNCSTYTNKILNLSIFDEEYLTNLNNTVEISLSLLTLDRNNVVNSIGTTFTNANTYQICLKDSLVNGSQYSMDAVLKYYATGYVTKYYIIRNFILNANNNTALINLYNLNSSQNQDFTLTYTNANFVKEDKVLVYLERQYISENTFKLVELTETDTNGQTILHIVTNNIYYNIKFIKDGVLIKEYQNMRFFCNPLATGLCELKLNGLTNSSNVQNYNEFIGLYADAPVYNSTSNDVSFSFTSVDGKPKTVNLRVEKRDIFGNQTLCSNSVFTISGTVSCNIGSSTDNNIYIIIEIDGIQIISTPLNISSSSDYGSDGFVVWFIITLGLVLISSRDKNAIVLSLIVSYVGAVALGITLGGVIGIGSAGIWIFSITLIALWRINKNKFS